MKKEAVNFSVKYVQILKENGAIDRKLMPKLTNSQIKHMYKAMVFSRTFDTKAIKLQRQGRMGTYASSHGQEASHIAPGFAMGKDDFVFPSFRENGLYLVKGMPPEMLYQYWSGDERGMKIPKGLPFAPVSITVGAHMVHAVGYAKAKTYLKQKGAVLTFFGDGATSEGDFHEAMNFAGVYKAPVVFVCQNNQYAISLPVKEQTSSKTLAQKAIAYGIEGIQVDGNDIFAVYKVIQDALKKAYFGKGPTLVECLTYRVENHTTSDEYKKYRSEKEVKEWAKKDPILRLKKYMQKKKIFSPKYEKLTQEAAEKVINAAVEKFEAFPPQNPDELFDYLYSKPTKTLEEQKNEVKNNTSPKN